MQRRSLIVTVAVLAAVPVARAGGFLSVQDGSHTALDFRTALEEVMGCGSAPEQELLSAVRGRLTPIWHALPKDGRRARVEWRMMRYMAHRYFMQTANLHVRGLDLMRQVNDSSIGNAEVLDQHAPSLSEMFLDGKRSSAGFSLDDAVTFVAALERVIADQEAQLLEASYLQVGLSPAAGVSHAELIRAIDAYLWKWQGQRAAPGAIEFAEGVVRTMEHRRHRTPQLGEGRHALEGTYTFEDAREAVATITKTFGSWWESECQAIKRNAVSFDRGNTGRIRLSEFYKAYLDGHWQFQESEAYMRSFGALDETSRWRGKQVILANYVQGPSNCVVSAPFYQVCCAPECEEVLYEIEDAIGAPSGRPEEVLALVKGMSSFEDQAPAVGPEMVAQLQKIAKASGGRVPLHGRLFAQWLHYVFPHECPYPHKAGERRSTSLDEFRGAVVSRSEAKRRVRELEEEQGGGAKQKEQEEVAPEPETQWEAEEELYSKEVVVRPARGGRLLLGCAGVAALVAVFGGGLGLTDSKGAAVGGASRGLFEKQHLV